MFGKVKKWLGIEGVKLDLMVPEEVNKKEQEVNGQLHLSALTDQTITSITVKLIEKYTRGRGESKLIDEFVIGEIVFDRTIDIGQDTPMEIDFVLPFEFVKSEMDEIEEQNIFKKGLVSLAKLAEGVKSTYRIEASAEVKGVALNPLAKEIVNFV